MTQIAQTVSLSLNQALGEFNMRLNGLQQQVVHQQNAFAQAQVQQAASQPAQVPVAKTSPSISSGLPSFGDRPPTSPQPNFPRNTVEQPPGAVLRLELAKAGLILVDSLVAWEAASRYVTAMHNLHGKIQNTGKTGKELLRNTSEGTRILRKVTSTFETYLGQRPGRRP